jgi:hypothetical protein
MIRNNHKIKGSLTLTVYTIDGEIKRRKPTWLQKFLGLPGSRMISVNHNIVTDQGDALVADLMSEVPAKQKLDNLNAFIQVGTGWTGVGTKQNEVCNTPTGSPEGMEATYPKLKGSFGNADDNVVQYRALFEAGDLNATGIDEAALINNSTPASADCFAYAEVTPAVDVTLSDTLQVDWEITFLGV